MYSDLNSWNSSTKTEGTRELISNDFEAVSVSIDISGSCTLKVLWSNINTSLFAFVDYGDTFNILDGDYNFCVSKKAKYFYIKIENPTIITKLKVNTYFLKNLLKSTSELSATSAVICYAKDPNNNDVPLKLDASGFLKTTSSGGDASASNQLLQITEAETTNTTLDVIKAENMAQTIVQEAINEKIDVRVLKCDTDNISGEVSVSNMVDVSTLATQSTLNDTLDEVTTINEQITPLQYENSYSDILTQGATMGADTNPAFSYSETQNAWYWQNSILGASNLYFYANTQTKQNQYLISDLKNSYAIVKLGDLSATTSLPFLVVYSRPQGSGDYVPGFYRSTWVYTIPNSTELSQIGQEMLLYWGELPSEKIHPNVRRVECTLAVSRGPALQSETLQFLTINTDSLAPVNTVKVNYSNVGFTTGSGLVHNVELGYGSQNTTKQVTDKIDDLNSTIGAGLFVKNTDATALITAGRDASAVKVADNEPSVNGPVQIGASVDTNGYMYVNVYISVVTVVSGGSVHLEFSPDNTMWGRAFYSAFLNIGTNQTALITVSSPLPWRYVRLYADSGVELSTVNAYISMK